MATSSRFAKHMATRNGVGRLGGLVGGIGLETDVAVAGRVQKQHPRNEKVEEKMLLWARHLK
jgi:hypothetical protein